MSFSRRDVSRGLDHKSPFEPWEIAVAKTLVDQFRKKHRCLRKDDFDDQLQEVLTHWLSNRDRYDAARQASRKTFMGRVLRNKLTDLVRERESDKRKVDYCAVSLDEPLADEEDSSTLGDTIDESTVEGGSPDPFFRVDLRIDLSKALQKLTPYQKRLCRLLAEKGLTVKEASEYLETPRSTIYDELERIRKIFEREGLAEYL